MNDLTEMRTKQQIFDDLLKQHEALLEEVVQDSIAWGTGTQQEQIEIAQSRATNARAITSLKEEYEQATQ